MPLSDFPLALRQLVEAEIEAGNEVQSIGAGYPAPPAGERLMLKNAVTTALPPGIRHIERNGSSYKAEYFDAARFYFVVTAPEPPAPQPDMDAIREQVNRPKPEHGRDPIT